MEDKDLLIGDLINIEAILKNMDTIVSKLKELIKKDQVDSLEATQLRIEYKGLLNELFLY
jgi:hypothetical protein